MPTAVHFAHRIDQRLQLHTTGALPLSKRRARDSQAGVAKLGFLALQRQMVSKLRNHDVGQQARCRGALVDPAPALGSESVFRNCRRSICHALRNLGGL